MDSPEGARLTRYPDESVRSALHTLYTALDAGVSGPVLDTFGGRIHRRTAALSPEEFAQIDAQVRQEMSDRRAVGSTAALGYETRPGTDGGDTPTAEPATPLSAR